MDSSPSTWLWEVWDLFSVWVTLGIGLVVSGGVFVLGRRAMYRSAERRRHLRRGGEPARIIVCGPFQQRFAAELLDRSEGGLGLLVERKFDENEVLSVRSMEAPEHVPWAHLRVRHCTPYGRRWLVGCQYEEGVPWMALVWFG